MNLLRTLHAWGGMVLALFLVVIGLSGTVSVLRGEIVRATVPAARLPAPPAVTFGPALERFEAGAPGQVRSVKFAPYDLGVHRLYLAGGEAAFLDPEGRIVQRWGKDGRFDDWALSLHHQLLAGKAGERVAGAIGLGGLGLTLSGVLIWAWPRPRLGLRVWPRTSARRDLLAAHKTLGSILAVFLVVQLATGAGMALGEWVRPLMQVERAAPPRVAPTAGPTPWSRILAAAQAIYPNAAIRRVSAPQTADAPFVVTLQQPAEWNPEGATEVYVDGAGAVAGTVDSERQALGARLYNAFLGVHSGAYAGAASRLVSGLIGVGLTMLGLLGAWAFVKGPRWRPRTPRRQPPAPARAR